MNNGQVHEVCGSRVSKHVSNVLDGNGITSMLATGNYFDGWPFNKGNVTYIRVKE